MSARVHALFVGIDAYPAPVRPLSGCGNDVTAVHDVLAALLGDRLDAVVLRDGEATREGVIRTFREHLRQAGEEDTALFYYSGHGAQCRAPEGMWGIEQDRRLETIVCVDSRLPDGRDLADKELGALVAEVGAAGADVVVILDCCHSGSGVRGIEGTDDVHVRQIGPDLRERPLDSFLPGALERARPADGKQRGMPRQFGLDPGEARWILLAACDAGETAKEQPVSGRHRGVFSVCVESALTACAGRISYADLIALARTRVRDLAVAQTPQLESADPADGRRLFLGDVGARSSYRLTRGEAGWWVDAGAALGVPAITDDDRTSFTVYAPGTDVAAIDAAAIDAGTQPVAVAVARRVEVDRCTVDVRPLGGPLDASRVYPVTVRSWAVPPMPVHVTGEAPPIALLQHRWTASGGASAEVTLDGGDGAELVVEADSKGYRIRRSSDGRLVTGPVTGTTAEDADRVLEILRRVARWRRLRDLDNPTSTLQPGELELRIGPVRSTPDAAPANAAATVDTGDVHVSYDRDGRRPRVSVAVTNGSSRPLWVSLLGLSDRFGVTSLLTGTWGEWVGPGQTLSARGGRPVPMTVSDGLWEAGVTEVVDVVKVLAATEPFFAEGLQQGELDEPPAHARSAPPVSSALDRMIRRVGSRGFGSDDEDGAIAPWTTTARRIVTVRPAAAVEVPVGGLTLGAGVEVRPPAAGLVTLSARIVGLDAVTREAGQPSLPPLLQEGSTPVPLLATRDVDDDPGILELSLGPDAAARVTPDNPVLVTLPTTLAAGEHLLAVAFDGEYWLSVGAAVPAAGLPAEAGAPSAGETVVVAVGNLPVPVTVGDRDLVGSVKLLFRKVVHRHVNVPYPWPRLALARADADGSVHYDVDGVRAAVAAATRVLVYVHGIIGDTEGMVRHGAAHGLHDPFDAVLTFDYENLDTPVAETARLFGQRLAEAGVGPGHRVTVVAHSMGGLVSRWYVEHEGGRDVVDRLVLAGTPSAGSPWPTVEDWAMTALAVGMNALGASGAWPAAVVGWLARFLEKHDNALDDMRVGSPFLADLGAQADPEVPYVVVAGDRSGMSDPRVEGLLKRLRYRAWNLVDALAFFSRPNDIAVSVESAGAVPTGRSPSPVVHRVGCDHMTYFESADAEVVLREVLG